MLAINSKGIGGYNQHFTTINVKNSLYLRHIIVVSSWRRSF